MTPCTPIMPMARAVAPLLRARPHRVVHYVTSHKAKMAVGHHAVSGHRIAHLPIVRHAPPPVRHVARPAADTGACGVSDTTRKLHADGGPAGAPGTGKAAAGQAMGGKAAGIARVGGLAAGGAAVGIGAVAAMAGGGMEGFGGGAPGFGNGYAAPGYAGAPGYGGPGYGGPGYGGPGYSGPGVGTTGGGQGGSGGGPQVGAPGGSPTNGGGAPVVVVGSQATTPVNVPEPSTIVVLAAALLALTLTRWASARR